jgi:hypothetical protein
MALAVRAEPEPASIAGRMTRVPGATSGCAVQAGRGQNPPIPPADAEERRAHGQVAGRSARSSARRRWRRGRCAATPHQTVTNIGGHTMLRRRPGFPGLRSQHGDRSHRIFAVSSHSSGSPGEDVRLHVLRLPPIRDRPHGLRSEQRQPQEPTDAGRVHAPRSRQVLRRGMRTRVQHLPPTERPRERLDQGVVGAAAAA